MKNKNDFFSLLDKCLNENGGRLPNGDKIGRSLVCRYILSTGETYISELGFPIRSFEKWYIDWWQSRVKGIVKPPVTPVATALPVAPLKVAELSLSEKIKSFMYKKKEMCSLEELSDQLNVGIGKIREAIKELSDNGHTVKLSDNTVVFSSDIPKSEDTVLSIKKLSTGFYKFGVCGDNHLCSRYERLDVLNALYDYYQSEGIKIVYNTGNWVDGEARFNKHDIHTHGMDNQIKYFIENYPKREGIETRFITGDDHEGWYTQREGINIGKYMEYKAIEEGRNDLIFLGHMEHDEILKTKLGETRMRILHPGGGSSYATSYSVQKIVESYTGGDKPDILFVGHYHKAEYTYYRGVHICQSGCTMDQNPFMRKKKLAAHLGGWVIEFSNDDKGAVTRFKGEFIPFYDKDYYKSGWEYKH